MMKESVFSQWFALLLLLSAFWWAGPTIREAPAMGKDRSARAPLNDPTDLTTLLGQTGTAHADADAQAPVERDGRHDLICS